MRRSPPLRRLLRCCLLTGLWLAAAPAHASDLRCEAIGTLATVEERRGGMFRVSGLIEDGAAGSAIGLCGGTLAGVVWQARAAQTWHAGGDDRQTVALRHLYRRFDLDDAWSVTVGKGPRGVDVGYAAQPLDFLGEARTPLDTEDRLSERKASLFAAIDHARGDDAFSLVIGEARQGDRSRAQVIGTAETRRGATHLLAVAQKSDHLAPGLGGGFSTVFGQSLELHGSLFLRPGSDRPVHLALLDGRPRMFGPGEAPVAAWRTDSAQWFPRWVVGGQWTAESGLNVIAEWLHDQAGLSPSQWSALRALTDFHAAGAALGAPAAAVDGNLRHDARVLSAAGAMRDYAFIRLSHPFPSTEAEVRALINLADASVAWGLRLTWQLDDGPLGGLLGEPLGQSTRLWLEGSLNHGRRGSEFGSVPTAGGLMLATSIVF